MNQIDKIQALYEAGTPGKWECIVGNVTKDDVIYSFNNFKHYGCMSKEDGELISALHSAWPKIKRVLDDVKLAVETISIIDDAISQIRMETNDTLHEASVKHDCINLRNCLSYLEGVRDSFKDLTSAPEGEEQRSER